MENDKCEVNEAGGTTVKNNASEMEEDNITSSGDGMDMRKSKSHGNWSKFLKPWKWKKKKKSEEFKRTAATLERKISVRSTKEDLINRGVLRDPNGTTLQPVQEKNIISNDYNESSKKKSKSKKTSDSSDKYSGDKSSTSKKNSLQRNENSASSAYKEVLPNKDRGRAEPQGQVFSDVTNTDSVKRNPNPQDTKNAPLLPPGQHKRNSSNPVKQSQGDGNETTTDSGRSLPPQPQVAVKPFHKKFPSDSVTNTYNQEQFHPPVNHRHSYQIATSNQQPYRDQKVSIGQFQVKNATGDNMFAVVAMTGGGKSGGPLVVGVKRSNGATGGQNPDQTAPQPMARTKVDSNKPDKESNQHPVPRTAWEDTRNKPESYQQNKHPDSVDSSRWSDSQNKSTYNKNQQPRNQDSPIHRNQGAVNSSKGLPPKPPPKPSKENVAQVVNQQKYIQDTRPPLPPSQNKPHYQDPSRPPPSIQVGGNDVQFAGSNEIIQRNTNITIPSYLRQNYAVNTTGPVLQTPQQPTHYYDSDSDDSGPILYRDDPPPDSVEDGEEDEDETTGLGGLAAKVARKDTLAMRLQNRPSMKELEERNIIPSPQKKADDLKNEVKVNLTRRLSQRPTKDELLQRNIIPNETDEDRKKEREKVKRQLTRKLSMRPTVQELIAKRVLNWHEYVEVYEVQNYDRRADKPWTRLTPTDKAMIRKELNEFKATEMHVHEESKKFTRFHRP